LGVQWKYNMSFDSHASPSERSLASLSWGVAGGGMTDHVKEITRLIDVRLRRFVLTRN
jgi:hypothetical protein